MRAVGVVLGIDGDGAELQLGCRTDDSERNLTAVSDQQARHVRSFLRSILVGLSVHPDHIMPLPRLPGYRPPRRRRARVVLWPASIQRNEARGTTSSRD